MPANTEGSFASRTKWDVAVVGGGTAGFIAALAAARAGAQTLVVERYQTLGGMLTGGLVNGLHTMRIHQGRRTVNPYQPTMYQAQQVVRGIAQEVVDRLVDMGGAHGHKGESASVVRFDAEAMKYLISEMLEEAGVDVWLDSLMTDVVADNGTLKAIVVHNKSGRHLVEADAFVDASGDADVAVAAGAPYEIGRPEDGRTMPGTMVFMMGGVDLAKTFEHLRKNPEDLDLGTVDGHEQRHRAGQPIMLTNFKKSLAKAVEAGDFPVGRGAQRPIPLCGIATGIRDGRVIPDETTHVMDCVYGFDLSNASDLSEAIRLSRVQVMAAVKFFQKYIPGFENAYLLQTADQLGVRETRRIVGDYVMKADDILNAVKFSDRIARGGRALNVHSEVGGAIGEGYGGQHWFEIKDAQAYDVPYRVLLPKNVEGLLVAGRCVSVDHMALGSLRGEPLCMATGQAAGVAAALASKLKVAPRHLDVSLIQGVLVAQDADLGGIPTAPSQTNA
ncbi:MAG: FAD-dependent oxidoreductase [Chloroflexi bacterium]|nr:FAD-dependent oxidoreductase [Chloroflexota bacterium]